MHRTSNDGSVGSDVPPSAGGDVPPVLLYFTAAICMGIMANFTLIVPTSTVYSNSLFAAAQIIASYAGGALISLFFWSTYGRDKIRSAYLAQSAIMIVGNVSFAIFARGGTEDSFGLLCARFVLGLEGGCMYNANLALVAYSSARQRAKYLSLYQAFVGGGLVLGPTISSGCLGIAALLDERTEMDVSRVWVATCLSSAVMALWGAVMLALMVAYLPRDEPRASAVPEETVDDSLLGDETAEEAAEPECDDALSAVLTRRQWLLCEMFLGNFFRIFQRLGWEVGAVVVLAFRFEWGIVAAGFSLAFFGLMQGLTQFFFAHHIKSFEPERLVHALGAVEVVALCCMYYESASVFVVSSLVFYLSNCLTAAPYNDIVLGRAREQRVRLDEMVLAGQYGIFAAFGCAPLAVRGAAEATRADATALASVLLVGWALQASVNALMARRTPSALIAALGAGLAAVVVAAMLDESAGGTGVDNVFSWHGACMALSFFAFMTSGQLVYRDDFGGPNTPDAIKSKPPSPPSALQTLDDDDPEKSYQNATWSQVTSLEAAPHQPSSKRHAFLMACAFVVAMAGFASIVVAHLQSGESQFGADESWSRTAHVALGYPIFAWLVAQVLVGAWKRAHKDKTGERIFKWHGTSGEYLLLAGYANCTLGFWLKMNYSEQGGWTFPLKLGLTAAALALFNFRLIPFSAKRQPQPPQPAKSALALL